MGYEIKENSSLFRSINEAFEKCEQKAKGIRVGITKDAEYFKPDNDDKTYWVKSLGWSIIDQNHGDLTDP